MIGKEEVQLEEVAVDSKREPAQELKNPDPGDVKLAVTPDSIEPLNDEVHSDKEILMENDTLSAQLARITTTHNQLNPTDKPFYSHPLSSGNTLHGSQLVPESEKMERTMTLMSTQVSHYHEMKERFLCLIIPTAAILVVVSFWSIYSTQWAYTKLNNHPKGITEVTFGPIQYCTKKGNNYDCQLNFIDTGSQEQLFNVLRTAAGASFIFSGLVFFSLWEQMSFGQYRQNLNLMHIVIGAATVALWFWVGADKTSWTDRRDYVWATYTNNGSDNAKFRYGFIGFCISNILAPLVYYFLFDHYLNEDEIKRIFQMQSEMQFLMKKQLLETGEKMENIQRQLTASYTTQTTDAYSPSTNFGQRSDLQTTLFQDMSDIIADAKRQIGTADPVQAQIRDLHKRKRKRNGSAFGFTIFIVCFGFVILGSLSSAWAKQDLNLDIYGNAEHLQFQTDFTRGSYSDQVLVLTNKTDTKSLQVILGPATEITYGPFSRCMMWDADDENKIERYRMCSGGTEGKKDTMNKHFDIHNWQAIVLVTASFFTLFTVTPIFTNYHYITAYLQLLLPFMFFIFSIVTLATWDDADAGDEFLPHKMDGVWGGDRGSGYAIFICAFLFFWMGSIFWTCCLNQHDGELDIDNRTICWFCLAGLRECVGDDFMSEEKIKELKDKAEKQKQLQYYYQLNTTLKVIQYSIGVVMILFLIQVFGSWTNFDIKFTLQGESGNVDYDLSITSLIIGRLCVTDNTAEYFSCGQVVHTVGNRTRFSLIQLVIYMNYASVVFVFWHFWEYLRNARPAHERSFWGVLSLMCGFISLITYFAGAGDCDFKDAGFDDYTGIDDLKMIQPFYECSATYPTGFTTKSSSNWVNSNFEVKNHLTWVIVYIVGLVLYALVFCAELYVYMNRDEYYKKSEHIIKFEKEQEAWKSTFTSKMTTQATFTATSSGPASSKDDTIVDNLSC